jgi:hypothetical protein
MDAKVGIFWIHKGEFIGVPVPVRAGADDGLFVNGPEGHAEAWERLQQDDRALRPFEYFQIPRGRVLFDKRKQRYMVYLDQTLLNRTTKQAVMTLFSLPPAETVFLTDLHYTTCRSDIDRLFDEA